MSNFLERKKNEYLIKLDAFKRNYKYVTGIALSDEEATLILETVMITMQNKKNITLDDLDRVGESYLQALEKENLSQFTIPPKPTDEEIERSKKPLLPTSPLSETMKGGAISKEEWAEKYPADGPYDQAKGDFYDGKKVNAAHNDEVGQCEIPLNNREEIPFPPEGKTETADE